MRMKYGGPAPLKQQMEQTVRQSQIALFDHLKAGIEALETLVKTNYDEAKKLAADLHTVAAELEQRLAKPILGNPCALCGEKPVRDSNNNRLIRCSTTDCMPPVTEEEWSALYAMRDHVKFVRRYEVAKEGVSWSRLPAKFKVKLAQQCVAMLAGEE